MKFVCDGTSLSEAIGKVSKACAVRTTAPIMECIKLSAFGEEVTLLASDGELSIRKSVKAEIFEEGEVCVPGKLFSDFIGKLSGEEISIATGDKGVEIRYRDAGTFMQSLPAEEFPKIDFTAGENSFTMKQADLKKIIAETTFCCAQDDSRPVLKGCLMEFGDRLDMTALDGYRLAIASVPILAKSGEKCIICPARTLSEIARMLEKEDEEITLYTQGGCCGCRRRERPSSPASIRGSSSARRTLSPLPLRRSSRWKRRNSSPPWSAPPSSSAGTRTTSSRWRSGRRT